MVAVRKFILDPISAYNLRGKLPALSEVIPAPRTPCKIAHRLTTLSQSLPTFPQKPPSLSSSSYPISGPQLWQKPLLYQTPLLYLEPQTISHWQTAYTSLEPTQPQQLPLFSSPHPISVLTTLAEASALTEATPAPRTPEQSKNPH